MKYIRLITLALGILLLPCWVFAETPLLSIDTGGHKALIRDIMFTSDGRYLISASDDKTIRVWETATGEVKRVLRSHMGAGHEGKIFAAALSPDDGGLAVGGYTRNHEIRLFNFRTGEVEALLKGHENVINGLAFSPDGKRLISGSADKTARIWDIATRKTVHLLKGHTHFIYGVAFSPDGRRAVTGSDDHTLKLWNAETGTLVKALEGHRDKVKSAVFTPDGRYLLSGGWDKTIRLWDGRTGAFLKVLATQNRAILSLAISPDGRYVLSGIGGAGSGGNECRIFSISSGEEITSFTRHRNIVLATALSPDGRTAATGGGDDNEIYLWDRSTGKIRQRLAGKGKKVWSVGFSKDGCAIAWGRTWESGGLFSYGSLEHAFSIRNETGGFELAMGEALKSDSGYLRGLKSAGPFTIRTKNGKIHPTLEILKNNRPLHEITRDSWDGYDHRSITLTPDGLTVISGGSNGKLTSYNPETGKKIHDFIGHTGDVWGVAVSPDSRMLVSGSNDQTVKLWEMDTGKLLLTLFQGTDNEWVAWTPEGYYTSSLKGGRYVGWHINRGEDRSALYYPASRFSRKFHSPEMVARYLETGGDLEEAVRLVNASKPARKQVTKATVADLNAMLPPAVFFQVPFEKEVTVTDGRIRIKGGAKSMNNEPIEDIWVLVNGRRAEKNRGIRIKNENKRISGLRAEIDLTLPLTQKENRISLIASNRFTQSEPEMINVRWEKEERQRASGDLYKPDLYLLSIGVSRYQKKEYNLDVAARDAEGIASVFERQAGKLYRSVKTRVLTDQNATRGDLLDGLDWIMQSATQKDLSVIFLAGHGIRDNRNNYYFLPHDSDPEKLRRTGVKWLEFEDVLTSLPSKVLLLVDTCHSGSVTGKRRGASDITDALRELVNTESGVVVMAAATGKELSQERREWGHGAFTKALIEGLEGKANYNDDPTIDLKELDLYITDRVKALTNGEQHPTTEIPRTMPNFPIVYR